MYSFSQRCDTQCIDEPLYAHYLRRTGFTRPYQQDLFASQEKDGGAAMAKLRAMQQEPSTKPLLFIKHMAKMKYGLNNDALFSGPDKHVLLVRDPYQVITSFARVLENPTLLELGYSSLLEIVSELRSRGKPIIILLSDQLVKHPEATLRRLCGLLEIPFLQEMLSWPPGPKPCDGLWAPWWYENSHKSTCFEASVQTIGREPMPDHLKPLLSECSVIYNLLKKSALIFDVPPSPSLSSSDEVLSTHSFATDARNNNVLVMIRDGLDKSERLVVRDQAQVSVFESAFLMGDGVWEGLRVHKGCPLFLEDHLERLYEGALALDMTMDLHQTQVEGLINECLQANGMTGNDHIHIRLCVSRGVKSTPYQSPYLPTQLGSPTIVIIPEYKNPSPQVITRGLKLFTVHVRRGDPSVQDPGLNSHSKGNCIQGCIQAHHAGADEGLMLDPQGFVATCNSTNFFIIRKGELWAPRPQYQMPGITRSKVIEGARKEGLLVRELDISLRQVYSACEAFTTGTFGGLTPVRGVDGRTIGGERLPGSVTLKLMEAYGRLKDEYVQQKRELS